MIIKQHILLVAILLCFSTANADVISKNNIIVGYEHLLDAEGNNPNLYDQPYLVLGHSTSAHWGDITGWVRLENPTNSANNQNGVDAGSTTKIWLKIDYNISESPFNIWSQSFTNANKTVVEQDVYLGASYDIKFGKLKGTFGLGMQYAYGSFTPTGKSFNGVSGAATTLVLGYPITPEWFTKLYYEAQFNRSAEHKDVLSYDSYGHQLVLGIDYRFNPQFFVGTSYKHRQSWGGAINDGGEIFFEAGYTF